MPRRVLSKNERVTVYEVTNDKGEVVGRDIQPVLTSRDANAAQMRDKLRQGIVNLEQADVGWAGLTAGQKDAATRLAVRGVAKLARLQLSELDAN